MFPRVIRQASQRGNCHSTSAIWFLLAPRRPIFLRKSKRCRKVTSLRTCVNIPQFKFPKAFIGGCNRSFNHVWLDQHKWLCMLQRKVEWCFLHAMSVCFSIVCQTLLARFLVHLSPSHFRHGRRNQPSLHTMRRPATTSALFNWQSS